MVKHSVAIMLALIGACLSQVALSKSYHNYHYNSGNSRDVSWSGTAMKFHSDGTVTWVPVHECEGGCSIDGVCGTEKQCNTARIVGITIGSIFGGIFLCCCLCFCCGAFRAATAAPAMVAEEDSGEYKNADRVTVTTTYTTNTAPGATATYYPNPAMMQPGMAQPGMMQPGMAQPGMMQPGMVQPGMVQPGMM